MSTGKTRTRSFIIPLPSSGIAKLGTYFLRNTPGAPWTPAGGGIPDVTYNISGLNYPGRSAQITLDELHSGPPYKEGGPFRSLKIVSCEPYAPVVGKGVYTRLDDRVKYVGGFRPPTSIQWGADLALGPYSTTLVLNSPFFPEPGLWGDRAWNKAKPKIEKAGAGVFFAELRDLPRMLKTTAGAFHDIWKTLNGTFSSPMAPKKAANHFLNHQFGWVPFLSDIRKFYNVYQDSTNIIDRLSEENGQWIRKRVTLAEEKQRTRLNGGTGIQLFPNTSFSQPATPWFSAGSDASWELYEEISTYVSAVGKFRYYRPEFDKTLPDYSSGLQNLNRQLSIFGARVSPSNIYKATPWTWAIDWFANVDDYIDRVNDVQIDSISAQYFYLMQHQVVKRIFRQILPFQSGTVVLKFVRLISTKQRTEGQSPYGFNLTWDNLSPRQIAIAGALGISKFG